MDTFEHKGRTFSMAIEPDLDHGHPWEEEDGHGPVSDWTSRDKRPGEMVLASSGGRHRFYDFAEAVKIAKRDRWDAPPYGEGTAGQKASRAALADFNWLRRYCSDQWSYVGVVVTLLDGDGEETDQQASLWGICDDDPRYLEQTARELAAELD